MDEQQNNNRSCGSNTHRGSSAIILLCLEWGGDDPQSEDVATTFDYTDHSVTVYTDAETAAMITDHLSPYSSDIVCVDDISTETNGEIIIFDENWIYDNDAQLIDEKILDCLSKGIPVLFLGENLYLFKDSGIELSVEGYSEQNIAYGVFEYEDGKNFSYDIADGDLGNAIVLMYGWASELISGKNPYEVVSTFSWMKTGV